MESTLDKARNAFTSKKYVAALRLYERAAQEDPSDAFTFEGIGYASLMLNKFDEARKNADQALRLNDQLVRPRVVIAYVLLHEGRYEEAFAEAKLAYDKDVNSAEVLECYGTALLYRGDSEQAITTLEAAVALNPGLMLAHRNLTYLYGQQHEAKKALASEKAVFRAKPTIRHGADLALAYFAVYHVITITVVMISLVAARITGLKIILGLPAIYTCLILWRAFAMLRNRARSDGIGLIILSLLVGVATLYLVFFT